MIKNLRNSKNLTKFSSSALSILSNEELNVLLSRVMELIKRKIADVHTSASKAKVVATRSAIVKKKILSVVGTKSKVGVKKKTSK